MLTHSEPAVADACLAIEDLHVEFPTPDGVVHAVNGASYGVARGETLGIVGESGSGKSVSVLAAMGLIRPPGRVISGHITFQGKDLRSFSRRDLRKIRGQNIALVSQDPMTSFNPVMKVGRQLAEAIRVHDSAITRQATRSRAIDLLESVGVPNPARRYDQYPHEYSGGMRQRAMIAIAMANHPDLLIADEPTTALDVTIQAQVLEVLDRAVRDTNTSMILITHDLGVIAEMADRVAVMYAGRVVEYGSVRDVFHTPRHPYTVGLMGSLPSLDRQNERLTPITGNPPSLLSLPPGCPFVRRCELAAGRELADRQRCTSEQPQLRAVGTDHGSACHFHDEVEGWRSVPATGAGGAAHE